MCWKRGDGISCSCAYRGAVPQRYPRLRIMSPFPMVSMYPMPSPYPCVMAASLARVIPPQGSLFVVWITITTRPCPQVWLQTLAGLWAMTTFLASLLPMCLCSCWWQSVGQGVGIASTQWFASLKFVSVWISYFLKSTCFSSWRRFFLIIIIIIQWFWSLS